MAAWRVLCWSAALAGLVGGWAWSQNAAPQSVKRKPAPTSFPKQTEDAFFQDVVRQHGEGTFREIFYKRPEPVRPAAEIAWSKIITADALKAEIAAAALAAGPHLESPAKWRAGHQQVRQLFSTLAICFEVIDQYDGKAAYQKHAPALRDALADCAEHCRTPNDAALLEARLRLKELTALVGGEAIKLPAVKDKHAKPWGGVPIGQIMQRIERGFAPANGAGGIDRWTANAKDFKAAKATVEHEAHMLALLAKVVQDPNAFEHAADAEFAKFALSLEIASSEIVAAAKASDHAAARVAAGSMTKSCTGCHAAFR